ncbi:MAG: DUF86 domain-containing protein [Cyanobacteria bacterium P01_C01_bin.89]
MCRNQQSRNQNCLIDIADAIELIAQYTQNCDRGELGTNMEKQDAVLRRIMIIGEAAKRLSEDFRQQHSSVPWREIIGMYNIVAHDYDSVDLDEVWKVINIDLPELLKYVQPLIDS